MPKPQLKFLHWVPEAARHVLQAQHDASPPGVSQDLIERLATDVRMSTVWSKVRSKVGESHEKVTFPGDYLALLVHAHARFAYFALYYAQDEILDALIAPKDIETPTLLNLRLAARGAKMLRDAARKLHHIAAESWASAWHADRNVTPDKLLKILDVVAIFYEKLGRPVEDLIRATPQIVKRGPRNARQNAYTLAMSRTVKAQFGRWCDEAVAALVEVVFDLPEPIEVEAVRSLRRYYLAG